jgi:tetratricopeptide (TPR) repeat protein
MQQKPLHCATCETDLGHIKVAKKAHTKKFRGVVRAASDAALPKGIRAMTSNTSRALVAAVFLATSALIALPASAATLSDAVARHLMDVQTASKKQDWAAAKAAIAAAAAVSTRTAFDDYTIARMTIAVDANTNDMAGASVAAQAAADSPAQDDKDKASNANVALELTMYTKQYDKAIKYAKYLETTNPTDPKMLSNIANAYYFGNDFASAKAMAQKQIDVDTKAGRVPDHNALMVLMSAAAGLKDEPGAEAALELLVVNYNQPEDWAQMIDIAFGTPGLRDVDAVWLGRLLFLTGAPVSQNTGNMIGSISGHLAFFGDAVNAKAHGAVVDPDPGPRADADKKTISQQIAAEDKQNGTYSAKLAEALYSYGMYPEAEEAANKAITKGGNPDTSEAPMILGQAQTAQAKYDDALASFGKVTGGGPATARITKLWVDYVTIKKRPPAAAPAAAQATK